MLVKVRFIKNEKPYGREYLYQSLIPLEIGDAVELPNGGAGIVTEVDVLEDGKGFNGPVKEIKKARE